MIKEVEIFNGKWLGTLLEEGPEQSLIRITKGPAHMVGLVQCLMNGDWGRKSERKSSGRERGPEYDQAGAKTKESRMTSDESAAGIEQQADYVTQYNELAAEAREIGLTAKPISTRFRDQETGAKRCEALAAAIEAQRAKIESGEVAASVDEQTTEAEPPPAPPKPEKRKKKMAKASTAKKKAAAPKGKAKKAVAKPAAPAGNHQLTGVEAEFCDKGGTLRGKAVSYLASKKNKKVPLTELYRAVYEGKPGDAASMVKLKTVIMGLNLRITDHKLPYTVEYDGKGEDLAVVFGTKSGR